MGQRYDSFLNLNRVDLDTGVLHGVIVAEIGEAKGHGFQLDEGFLDDLVEIGNQAPVKVRINHPDDGKSHSVLAICGEATNFRKEGDCVRADIELFDVPAKTNLLTLAEEAPQHFGLSLDFQGRLSKQKRSGLRTISCDEIHAVDFVDQPAAVSALFHAVDTPEPLETQKEKFMPKTKLAEAPVADPAEKKDEKPAERNLAAELDDVKKCMAEMSAKLDSMSESKDDDKPEEKLDDTSDEKKDDKENADEERMARMAAKVTRMMLAKLGVTPQPSAPIEPAPIKKDEPELNDEQKQLAIKLGVDPKAYAANLKRFTS